MCFGIRVQIGKLDHLPVKSYVLRIRIAFHKAVMASWLLRVTRVL